MEPGAPVIATWFVADSPDEATYFPQVGARSDAPKAQAAYWRCIAVFFASSLVHNPQARHVFFTNTALPVVDGVELGSLLRTWGVEVIDLPIRHRLPRGSVASWGNQFYVFDIIDHVAAAGWAEPLVVLDCDCVWRRPAQEMTASIAQYGALAYELGVDEHPAGEPINGLSREGMARFIAAQGGDVGEAVPYCGGEILAVRPDIIARISARAEGLWPAVVAQESDAPREEAHLLSIIYALEGIAPGTANRFIRRMWTTFHHHNLVPDDRALAIWHLPAEKRSGFADLFRQVVRDPGLNPRRDGPAMGLTDATIARAMGYPRRRPAKLARDLGAKLAEKVFA